MGNLDSLSWCKKKASRTYFLVFWKKNRNWTLLLRWKHSAAEWRWNHVPNANSCRTQDIRVQMAVKGLLRVECDCWISNEKFFFIAGSSEFKTRRTDVRKREFKCDKRFDSPGRPYKMRSEYEEVGIFVAILQSGCMGNYSNGMRKTRIESEIEEKSHWLGVNMGWRVRGPEGALTRGRDSKESDKTVEGFLFGIIYTCSDGWVQEVWTWNATMCWGVEKN